MDVIVSIYLYYLFNYLWCIVLFIPYCFHLFHGIYVLNVCIKLHVVSLKHQDIHTRKLQRKAGVTFGVKKNSALKDNQLLQPMISE